MQGKEISEIQEAYLDIYQELDEKYVDPFQTPHRQGRSNKGNPSKGETFGNPATLSPAMRSLQKSDQLQKTEPGSRRQKMQTKRAGQLAKTFHSARNAPGGRGASSSLGGVGNASSTKGFIPGSGRKYGSSGIGLADEYNIIFSHLLDEGYAETPEAAEVIMVNMSEEWKESIIEELLDERNRGEREMIDQEVRRRRDKRDGDTTSGGFKPYVRAGGTQRSEHERNRGKKKTKSGYGRTQWQ